MNERLAKAEALFHDALELPPELRDGFLRKACGEDGELHREVGALLRASGVADNWLRDDDIAAIDPSSDSSLPDKISEGPGTVIGRYKLLERIGEGGFGVVYMAEQEQPVRRRVAIKVIKLGMDTRQVVARFEAERQALALMDHPHIAKVLDAGATDAGRPYFVMELVRGVPITQFCEEQRLNTNERLELFIEVCSAIQHAHQKGIIHRDIKPSNVLVTHNEGVPHPMVIDFGVAKALNQRLTEHTLFTQFALMIGTPAYMSPEQAEMGKLDVDTRSDVYSLGVMLYELLTGTTPFPEERLRTAGYAEMQRIICEEEPERPSTRITKTRVAADVRRLNSKSEIRGPKSEEAIRASSRRLLLQKKSALSTDLDWIVMKCLEKDRSRRYVTASGLALDIQRHLQNEPVLARPLGKIYRFQKLVRRHKAACIAAALCLSALLLGLGASSWMQKLATGTRAAGNVAVSRLPKRNPQTPKNLIDLSRFYNLSLDGSAGWQLIENSDHAVQKGPQRFGEVQFDIRGAVRLASPSPDYSNLPLLRRVDGIKLMQKCRRLHFLHFVFGSELAGRQVATYRVHYSDGKTSDIPVRYGHDVRTWASSYWGTADPRNHLENTNSILAWTGTNVQGTAVRLFKTRWDNSREGTQIEAIDFISNMTDSSPVLVAITAEP